MQLEAATIVLLPSYSNPALRYNLSPKKIPFGLRISAAIWATGSSVQG